MGDYDVITTIMV